MSTTPFMAAADIQSAGQQGLNLGTILALWNDPKLRGALKFIMDLTQGADKLTLADGGVSIRRVIERGLDITGVAVAFIPGSADDDAYRAACTILNYPCVLATPIPTPPPVAGGGLVEGGAPKAQSFAVTMAPAFIPGAPQAPPFTSLVIDIAPTDTADTVEMKLLKRFGVEKRSMLSPVLLVLFEMLLKFFLGKILS